MRGAYGALRRPCAGGEGPSVTGPGPGWAGRGRPVGGRQRRPGRARPLRPTARVCSSMLPFRRGVEEGELSCHGYILLRGSDSLPGPAAHLDEHPFRAADSRAVRHASRR